MCSHQVWRRLGKLRARPCAVDWGCGGSLAPGLERADKQTYSSEPANAPRGARADEQRNGTRGCYPSIGSCRRRDHDRGSAWLRVLRGSPEEHRPVALSSALWVGCCGSRSFSGVANPRRNPGHTHKAPALGSSATPDARLGCVGPARASSSSGSDRSRRPARLHTTAYETPRCRYNHACQRPRPPYHRTHAPTARLPARKGSRGRHRQHPRHGTAKLPPITACPLEPTPRPFALLNDRPRQRMRGASTLDVTTGLLGALLD